MRNSIDGWTLSIHNNTNIENSYGNIITNQTKI